MHWQDQGAHYFSIDREEKVWIVINGKEFSKYLKIMNYFIFLKKFIIN